MALSWAVTRWPWWLNHPSRRCHHRLWFGKGNHFRAFFLVCESIFFSQMYSNILMLFNIIASSVQYLYLDYQSFAVWYSHSFWRGSSNSWRWYLRMIQLKEEIDSVWTISQQYLWLASGCLLRVNFILYTLSYYSPTRWTLNCHSCERELVRLMPNRRRPFGCCCIFLLVFWGSWQIH